MHDDVDAVEPCLAIGGEARGNDVRMHDAVEAFALDGSSAKTMSASAARSSLPRTITRVAKLDDDVHEGRGAGLDHAPREDIVVDDAGPKFAKTARCSRLASGDAARESDA